MPNNKKPRIIDEITSFVDCDVALMTTFNFDISFFDRTILPNLLKKKARVCLFVDSHEFKESIKENCDASGIGKRYFVQPVQMEKAFHPKLILLLGKDKTRLIVSSANVTYSSYLSNNELFQSYDFNEDGGRYNNLFYQAFAFFRDLADDANEDFINGVMGHIITKYGFLLTKQENALPALLTSYSRSIMNQAASLIKEEVKQIRVAVPFYDKDLSALSYIRDTYKNAKISLYLQHSHTTFPKEKYVDGLVDDFVVFKKINGTQSQFYHGKVFNFITDTKEYILYGSANFSSSALLRNFKNNGNIEADILDEGGLGSSDELFNSFSVWNTDISTLQTRPVELESNESEDAVSFVGGKYKNNIVEIYLKINGIEPKTITVNEVPIDSLIVNKEGDNKYHLCFPFVLSKSIFDLEIKNVDPVIKVRCYIGDTDYLNLYLQASNNNPFRNINTEEDIEKREKDWFLKKFQEYTNGVRLGIEQEKQRISSLVREDVNDDTSYEETEDDEELDSYSYDAPAYNINIGNPEIYEKASFYLSYFGNKTSMLLGKKRTGQTNGSPTTTKKDNENVDARRRTPFIRRLLTYFDQYADINNEKLSNLNFFFYFNLYELFSDSFITEIYLRKNNEINTNRLVEIKINYLINRLIPSIDTQAQNSEQFQYFKKELALLCLEINKDWPINIHAFKDALIQLDKLYNNTFIDEMERLMEEVGSILEINNTGARINYFRNFVFDSPKTEELMKLINDYYGFASCNSKIVFNEETNHLTINIDDFAQKDTFTIKLRIQPWLRDKIISYIERCYNIQKGKKISFEINIYNYSDKISIFNLQWNSSDYKHCTGTRTFSNGNICSDTFDFQ